MIQRLLSFCWAGNDLFCFGGFVIFMKYVRFAHLAPISPMLTLAFLCVVFSHENG